ncbi:MAG TPA: trypsin-like serine protease [Steroidobacteraceae bacterium]|nr:trypsin-like serine protease [Steroidobacteraceae bacterium]
MHCLLRRTRGPRSPASGTLCLLALSSFAPGAFALMAGESPDSPAARVDRDTASSQYSGVGSVVVNGSALSGVVIASQYVLTAGHDVSGEPLTALQFVLNLGGSAWTTAIESVTIYPTFSFPYDDLAVLKLVNPVPIGVPAYPMYSGPIATGLTITLVGYGGSGNGNVGVTLGASSTVKRVGENAVDQLPTSLDTSGLTSRFFVYDFDGPGGNGALGGPTLGNSLETVVAVGDSGSPAFVHNGNSLQLFGINTFVSSPVSGQAVNYEFGTLGGGIVAADPRFASWLKTATNGTLGVSSSGDVPLPLWSQGLLAMGLVWLVARRPRALRS